MYVPVHPDVPRIPRADAPAPRLARAAAAVSADASAAASTGAAAVVAEPKPPTFLRLSAGFVYFYFGFLKLFPDLSPAELIAGETLTRITGHMIPATTALWWLALMECCIGLCFLFRFKLHLVFFVFMFHQLNTFLPLFIVPEFCFKFAPFAPTMEGQYIFKNLISVAAGYTVMMPIVKARFAARRLRKAAEAAR